MLAVSVQQHLNDEAVAGKSDTASRSGTVNQDQSVSFLLFQKINSQSAVTCFCETNNTKTPNKQTNKQPEQKMNSKPTSQKKKKNSARPFQHPINGHISNTHQPKKKKESKKEESKKARNGHLFPVWEVHCDLWCRHFHFHAAKISNRAPTNKRASKKSEAGSGGMLRRGSLRRNKKKQVAGQNAIEVLDETPTSSPLGSASKPSKLASNSKLKQNDNRSPLSVVDQNVFEEDLKRFHEEKTW